MTEEKTTIQAEIKQPTPNRLPEPVPVGEQFWPPGTPPVVTIGCITFKQEEFIGQAIEGFLMQRTTFPVQILIHDDASPDRTAEIIRGYQDNHPRLIEAIYQSENQYSQGNLPSKILKPLVRGTFLAICEGDDFWTDPLKLQKQVDFLENNPDYGLVHGDCNKYFQETGRWAYNCNNVKTNCEEPSDKEDLFRRILGFDYKIRTATVLYRTELIRKLDANRRSFPMGDTPMWLELSRHTKFKYMDEVLAVYRVRRNSMSNAIDKVRRLRFRLAMWEMRVYYCKQFGYPVYPEVRKAYNKALLMYLLLDPGFEPEYPLFNPSATQKLRYKLAKLPFMSAISGLVKKLATLKNRLYR